jgi:hypothetical protein
MVEVEKYRQKFHLQPLLPWTSIGCMMMAGGKRSPPEWVRRASAGGICMVGPPCSIWLCGGFLFAHAGQPPRQPERRIGMSTVTIVVGLIVLVYLGIMAGIVIYSNTGKDPDPGKKEE